VAASESSKTKCQQQQLAVCAESGRRREEKAAATWLAAIGSGWPQPGLAARLAGGGEESPALAKAKRLK